MGDSSWSTLHSEDQEGVSQKEQRKIFWGILAFFFFLHSDHQGKHVANRKSDALSGTQIYQYNQEEGTALGQMPWTQIFWDLATL